MSTPTHPVPTGWHVLSDLQAQHPLISLLVIATIVVAIAALVASSRPRARPGRRGGPVYSFPRKLSEHEILKALGKVSTVQVAILKFIVDGYFEGVGPAEVAAHFKIKKTEAAKHLNLLHRLGLLYIKRHAGGQADFYLIESVMARVGEARFFDLIGLPAFA